MSNYSLLVLVDGASWFDDVSWVEHILCKSDICSVLFFMISSCDGDGSFGIKVSEFKLFMLVLFRLLSNGGMR